MSRLCSSSAVWIAAFVRSAAISDVMLSGGAFVALPLLPLELWWRVTSFRATSWAEGKGLAELLARAKTLQRLQATGVGSRAQGNLCALPSMASRR